MKEAEAGLIHELSNSCFYDDDDDVLEIATKRTVTQIRHARSIDNSFNRSEVNPEGLTVREASNPEGLMTVYAWMCWIEY